MAKDYKSYSSRNKKKPNSARKRGKTSQLKAGRWILWAIALLLAVGFVIGLIALSRATSKNTQKTVIVKETKSKPKVKPAPKTNNIKFEFYHMLSKPSVDTADAPAANTTTTPASPSRYILQVASLKNFADADALKAKLTLNGFNVAIKKSTSTTGTMWYRVQVGPFGSIDAAKNAQDLLMQNKISGIIRSVKTNP